MEIVGEVTTGWLQTANGITSSGGESSMGTGVDMRASKVSAVLDGST